MGVFLNTLVLYSQLLIFVLPLVGVYFELDPFIYIFKDMGLLNHLHFPFQHILRYIISFVCVLEVTRTVNLFLIAIMITYQVTFELVALVETFPICQETISLYTQLWLTHQYGNWMSKYSIAIFMSVGYILAILLNCFCVIGWKIFPISLYLVCVPTSMLIQFIIHVAIPLVVRTHDKSLKLVKYTWKENTILLPPSNRKLLKKQLRSLQTVTFQSGSIAKLDQATRLSYLRYNVANTADMLLLCKTSLETIDKISA